MEHHGVSPMSNKVGNDSYHLFRLYSKNVVIHYNNENFWMDDLISQFQEMQTQILELTTRLKQLESESESER